MKYIITNKKGLPLSYFYGNGNGRVRDMIGFAFKSYFTFETEEQALKHIEYMKQAIRERNDFDLKLSIKLFNLFDKLEILNIDCKGV